ncbi:hypothetical protein B0H13DRAFT_2563201 [Mycena leptocephala]|nr:hypothetical protein B0H13DRAFT_2563201 [Mycena leptocephala]
MLGSIYFKRLHPHPRIYARARLSPRPDVPLPTHAPHARARPRSHRRSHPARLRSRRRRRPCALPGPRSPATPPPSLGSTSTTPASPLACDAAPAPALASTTQPRCPRLPRPLPPRSHRRRRPIDDGVRLPTAPARAFTLTTPPHARAHVDDAAASPALTSTTPPPRPRSRRQRRPLPTPRSPAFTATASARSPAFTATASARSPAFTSTTPRLGSQGRRRPLARFHSDDEAPLARTSPTPRSRTRGCANVVRHVLRTALWVRAASAQRRSPSLSSLDHAAPALHAPSARGVPRPWALIPPRSPRARPALALVAPSLPSSPSPLLPRSSPASWLALIAPRSPSSPPRSHPAPRPRALCPAPALLAPPPRAHPRHPRARTLHPAPALFAPPPRCSCHRPALTLVTPALAPGTPPARSVSRPRARPRRPAFSPRSPSSSPSPLPPHRQDAAQRALGVSAPTHPRLRQRPSPAHRGLGTGGVAQRAASAQRRSSFDHLAAALHAPRPFYAGSSPAFSGPVAVASGPSALALVARRSCLSPRLRRRPHPLCLRARHPPPRSPSSPRARTRPRPRCPSLALALVLVAPPLRSSSSPRATAIAFPSTTPLSPVLMFTPAASPALVVHLRAAHRGSGYPLLAVFALLVVYTRSCAPRICVRAAF